MLPKFFHEFHEKICLTSKERTLVICHRGERSVPWRWPVSFTLSAKLIRSQEGLFNSAPRKSQPSFRQGMVRVKPVVEWKKPFLVFALEADYEGNSWGSNSDCELPGIPVWLPDSRPALGRLVPGPVCWRMLCSEEWRFSFMFRGAKIYLGTQVLLR